MNLKDKHSTDKPVSATALFQAEKGTVTALQILADQKLKEHITKIPALLVCVLGEAIYEDEKGKKEVLASGDIINIEALVKHWLVGITDSQLVLFR